MHASPQRVFPVMLCRTWPPCFQVVQPALGLILSMFCKSLSHYMCPPAPVHFSQGVGAYTCAFWPKPLPPVSEVDCRIVCPLPPPFLLASALQAFRCGDKWKRAREAMPAFVCKPGGCRSSRSNMHDSDCHGQLGSHPRCRSPMRWHKPIRMGERRFIVGSASRSAPLGCA